MSEVGRLRSNNFVALFASFVILVGSMNAVLRIPGTSFTLYYFIAPSLFLYLMIASATARTHFLIFSAVVIYGFAAGVAHNVPGVVMLSQFIFYLFLFAFIEFLILWRNSSRFFDFEIRRILDFLVYLSVFISALQVVFGFQVPSTGDYIQYGYPTAFFYTPNDIGLFLSTYLIVVLFDGRGMLRKLLLIGAIVGINFVNEARAGILACTVIIWVWVLAWLYSNFKRPVLMILISSIAASVLGVIFLLVFDLFDHEFIMEVVGRIVSLEPFRIPGSVYNRADALIFNIMEMKDRWWLGLGLGGSSFILTLPQYDSMTAKSLHNAIAELVFDLGPVFYLPFIIGYISLGVSLALKPNPNSLDLSRFTFLIALPALSIMQSAGYISNYGFWAAAATIWMSSRASVDGDGPLLPVES